MLSAVARCALWVLIAAISSGPALAEAGSEGPPAPAAPGAALVGNAVFPSAIDPKYVNEEPARALFHTCIDQYNNNNLTNANGGLKWRQKDGGYWGECDKRLTGTSSGPAPARDRGEKLERYTPDECAGIEKMLNQCTKPIGPGWKICSPMVPGNGSYLWLLEDKYPDDWGEHCWPPGELKYCERNPAAKQLQDLCDKICQHQVTPRDALYNYCP